MISPNTASNGPIVRYFIAQHLPDVFRREPWNIGVFVEKQGQVAARFFGERREPGDFDNRMLRRLKSPKAYRMWVRHWRKTISKHRDDWERRLLETNEGNFIVIPGGEVTATGDDPLSDVCAYLYSLLVSEGGLREALGGDEDVEAQSEIVGEVRTELRSLGIMKSIADASIAHPVYEGWRVKGARHEWHPVTFYQERERDAWAIEPISFVTRQKTQGRYHAGMAAYIFADLRRRSENQTNGKTINPISIIRATDEDKDNADVRYSLEVLSANSDVVDWLNESDRARFLEERNRIARSV